MKKFIHKAIAYCDKRKLTGIAMILILIMMATVTTTTAYIITGTQKVDNTFIPSKVDCSITEIVNTGIKSSVKVKNTGETSAFIRVSVIANAVDGSGNITGPYDISDKLAASGWTKASDGFYYYGTPVAAGVTTGELLKGSIALSGKNVTVLAEAIQSEPSTAVQEAWGFVPGT